MLRDRLHYLAPFGVLINLINFAKGFVYVRNRGYERRSRYDRATNRFPIERVAPAVVFIPGTPCLDKNFEEVDRPLVIFLWLSKSCEQAETHRVMCICNGKTLRLPEQPPGRRNKRLGKHHRRDCNGSQDGVFVV